MSRPTLRCRPTTQWTCRRPDRGSGRLAPLARRIFGKAPQVIAVVRLIWTAQRGDSQPGHCGSVVVGAGRRARARMPGAPRGSDGATASGNGHEAARRPRPPVVVLLAFGAPVGVPDVLPVWRESRSFRCGPAPTVRSTRTGRVWAPAHSLTMQCTCRRWSWWRLARFARLPRL